MWKNKLPILFTDQNGFPYGNLQADGKLMVDAVSFLFDIAMGKFSNRTPWVKLGYNGDVGTSEEDLWPVGGVYIPPSSAMQLEVVSSSADDTSNGTGIRQVILTYLDASYVQKTEIITLNGTTPVATVATDILRINNMIAYSVGTGKKAAGNIDLRHLSDTPIYTRIELGYTRGRNSHYTVPYGKTLYVYNVLCGSGGTAKPVRFTTRITYDVVNQRTLDFYLGASEMVITDMALDMPIELPTKLITGTDVKVSAITSVGGSVCNTILRGWLENV